jgi:hypothetical protein
MIEERPPDVCPVCKRPKPANEMGQVSLFGLPLAWVCLSCQDGMQTLSRGLGWLREALKKSPP